MRAIQKALGHQNLRIHGWETAKNVAEIANPEKIPKFVKKKDTAKIGPKSKKQKHRKLPTNEYYRRMKSFFLNIEPILSVFFFDMSFLGFPILSRHPNRVSNYRKFEQNSSGLPFCITNDCFLLLFPYNARKMHLKWFGSFLKIAVLAHFCHNIVPGISNRVVAGMENDQKDT